jgi:hypothetical protein
MSNVIKKSPAFLKCLQASLAGGDMNPLHKRRTGPGSKHNRKFDVVARTRAKEFIVLNRQAMSYDPQFAVASDGNAVAHFFSEDDARDYAKWKNKP